MQPGDEGHRFVHADRISTAADGDLPANGPIRARAEECLTNVEHVLVEEELEISDEIETTVFLDAIVCSTKRIKYGKYTDEEPPARSAVEVMNLPRGVDVGTRHLCCRSKINYLI